MPPHLSLARIAFRNFVNCHPYFYAHYAGWRSRSIVHSSVTNKKTDIVLDGIPRSANSFAWAAFTLAQKNCMQIAHHIHRPGQIISGVKLDKPVAALIRKPDDVVISRKLYGDSPNSIADLYKEYIWFTEAILPYKSEIVVADFSLVTKNFNRIIEAINKKFGTAFLSFAHTAQNVSECYRLIDDTWRIREAKCRTHRGRAPSRTRNKLKPLIQHEIEKPHFNRLRRKAKELYQELYPNISPDR